MKRATVSADGEMITVHIALTFRKRGGRKQRRTARRGHRGRELTKRDGQGAGSNVPVAEDAPSVYQMLSGCYSSIHPRTPYRLRCERG